MNKMRRSKLANVIKDETLAVELTADASAAVEVEVDEKKIKIGVRKK